MSFGAVGLVAVTLVAATFLSIKDLSDATDRGQEASERHDATSQAHDDGARATAASCSRCDGEMST